MILYVGSQLLSTLLTPSTPDRNQQMLMYGLPLVFAIFILLYEFPAGLLVYWITTNLWTVGPGLAAAQEARPDHAAQARRRRQGRQATEPARTTFFSKLTSGLGGEGGARDRAAPPPRKPSGPPPPSPRKKKKRSGRRR